MSDCYKKQIEAIIDEIRELERERFYLEMQRCLCDSCKELEKWKDWHGIGGKSPNLISR